MALFSAPFSKTAAGFLLATVMLVMPGQQGFLSSPAHAQDFLERLFGEKKAKPHRQRQQRSKPQRSAPAAKPVKPVEQAPEKLQTLPAVVPVPSAAPRAELPEQSAPDTSQPEPNEAAEQRPAKNGDPVGNPPVPTPRPEDPADNVPPPAKPEPQPAPVAPEAAQDAKPAEQSKPDLKPDDKPQTKQDDKPTERPSERPVETPVEKPAEKPATQSAPQPDKPARIYQVACPALIAGDVSGKLLPPIDEGEQCRAQSPLSLTAIGRLAPLNFAAPVTTNCAMAVTLALWSEDVSLAAREAFGPDQKITSIGTGSDYQCRKVNGASEGRISEHAFANGLDIMSFRFADGSETKLVSGWNGTEQEKKFWRAIHAASCKRFMTVIGPDGDAAHQTNMHLDQGCHGKNCEARICQ